MRRTLIKVHLWLGLTIGLLWAIQGMTGALLVFHREEDRWAVPQPNGGPPAPIDEVVAAAEQATDGAWIQRLAIADAHRDLINVYYADHAAHAGHGGDPHYRAVIVDASTAKVLGFRDVHPMTPFTGAPNQWIDMLHMALLGGRRGEIFIALSGLVLLSATALGLYIAWPPLRAWKYTFSYRRWRSKDQKLYGWHRAVGLCAGFILVVLALTGACVNLESSVESAAASFLDHRPPYKAKPLAELPATIAAGTALQIAQKNFPDAVWVRLFTPTPADPVYRIRFFQQGENRAWLGKTMVVVDAINGRVLDRYDAIRVPWSNRWIDAAFALHNGELLGLGGRILVLLTGLTLPVLYVTGIWRWVNSRRRTRA